MNLTTPKKQALGGVVILLVITLFVVLFINRGEAPQPSEVPSTETKTTEEAAPENAAKEDSSATPKTPAPSTSSKPVSRGCASTITVTKNAQLRALNLKWTACTSDNFQLYNVYRNGTVVFKSSDSNLTNFLDKNLVSGTQYSYKVCVSQKPEIVTCSNTVSATASF